MKTQSIVSDVTVQISSEPVLTLPRQLSRELGLRSGQKVSVRVRGGALTFRKNGKKATRARLQNRAPKRERRTSTFMDLVGKIPVKPNAPIVEIEELMSHHGYEQFERPTTTDS